MDFSKIRISMEKKLYEMLWSNLAGNTLIPFIPKNSHNDSLAHLLSGEYLHITKKLAPDIYNIFSDTLESLQFYATINLYISGNSDINAFTLPSIDPEDPHIVVINSGLAEILTPEEIKFVIGHEIGHLFFDSLPLDRLLNFVFKNKEELTDYNLKINLWKKMTELNADRVGLLACGDLNSAASALFKISSGMNPELLGINMDTYIKNFDLFFENFNSGTIKHNISESHPLISIRVKMLEHFSKTVCFNRFLKTNTLHEDTGNDNEYKELLMPILLQGNSPLSNMRKKFIAVSGIVAASADDEFNEDEFQKILSTLSGFDTFPRCIMKIYSDMNSNVIRNELQETIDYILNEHPNERYAMLRYLCGIIISDKVINQKEMLFLIKFSEEFLHFRKSEAIPLIMDTLRDAFIPKL